MNLKTATLIAIIGQVLHWVYWQCYFLFDLYDVFSFGLLKGLTLLVNTAGQGTLVMFLIILYLKQK